MSPPSPETQTTIHPLNHVLPMDMTLLQPNVTATNVPTHHNNVDDGVSTVNNRLQLSTQSIVQTIGTAMTENLCCTFQHCQGSMTGSSVCSCINSIVHGGNNVPHNPPAQVSFAQPTVVHFDPCETPGNATAPLQTPRKPMVLLHTLCTPQVPHPPCPFHGIWVHGR